MSCKFDSYVIGDVYYMSGGTCMDCGIDVGEYTATYLGMEVNQHKFRVHNHRCPGCGRNTKFAYADCFPDEGINVTEEFNVMFHNKESHWLGGSNAKR